MPRFNSDKLIIASHNAGKLKEIDDLLSPFGLQVVSAASLGYDEPEETEDTFAGNARIKAHFASKASGLPALSDDSGLMVDALGGAPGVYTADWAETEHGRDFYLAMGKVHSRLHEIGAPRPWRASFCATLCVAWPDGSDSIFEGQVSGQLTWPVRGSHGFGFDPMFVPDGHDETFGEMQPELKHAMSHRSVAFAKLVAHYFA